MRTMRMASSSIWLVVFVILGACTCGGRTECTSQGQLSLLTAVHDDGSCRRISSRGVLLYEASKLLLGIHNNKTAGYKLEVTVMDTCGSITGALKASMKALVSADINCLRPPHYLGIIGPDTPTNAEAVQKVTSVLKVPHIVRKASSSPYLHHLPEEDDFYIVQGVLRVIKELKWKSFTLVADNDDENDDDTQNIARKLTVEAIANNLCVLVHDNEKEGYTSHIVHIGKPEDEFFNGPANATILVVSEGDLDQHLNGINSSNTILLLEDARNDLIDLEAMVEKSKWWTKESGIGKYDPEKLREVRWLQSAIGVYAKALDTTCKKKKCKSQVSLADWNEVISKTLAIHNEESKKAAHSMTLYQKPKEGDLETLGNVIIVKSIAAIHWKGGKGEEHDTKDKDQEGEKNDDDEGRDGKDDDSDDFVPDIFKNIISKGKDSVKGCATALEGQKMIHGKEDPTLVNVSEMDDSEWWTMVGTVSGVGVAMFVVGILAVYIVYSNIRGPRSPGSRKGQKIERDTSLRRVGSEREMPNSGGSRIQRQPRGQQRRDNTSIRSNLSDRSV